MEAICLSSVAPAVPQAIRVAAAKIARLIGATISLSYN
jgi:hypothetical protein